MKLTDEIKERIDKYFAEVSVEDFKASLIKAGFELIDEPIENNLISIPE